MKIQTIGLSLRNKGKEGEAIPSVFRQLDQYGAKIRRGQLTLIGGAPGGGKSLLATILALFAKVPALYFSADSDKATFGARITASALNISLRDAEELVLSKDLPTLQQLDALTDHIWVNFDSSPSPKDIDEEIDCFAYITGEYPHLIIVDNLMDLSTGSLDNRQSDELLMDFCKQLARRTGSAVVILCHVTGAYTDGYDPIPRSGLMNKIDKLPRLILTLHKSDTNSIGVSVVKNSSGPAQADGSMIILLPVIPEMAWIGRGE